MSSSQTATVQILQSPREDQRVEVLLEQGEGVSRVALRYSTWTDGLGWCSQKTIHLDGDQLDDLHHALAVARQRINRQRADAGGQVATMGQVIQLPTLA
ncbi:MAG: hypothetical protein H7Y30_10070 [Pyrinomonadaceae bacterium]|nr:hypothetical protein [Pyrinomonadaceae bacterium]